MLPQHPVNIKELINTDYCYKNADIAKELKITQVLDKTQEYIRN